MKWFGHQVSDLMVRVRACHLATGKFGRKLFIKLAFRALAVRVQDNKLTLKSISFVVFLRW